MARQVALVGNRLCFLREAEIVPHEVHEVGEILAVMDGERRLQPDLPRRTPSAAGPRWRGRCRPTSGFRSNLPPPLPAADLNAALLMRWTRRVISTAARRENVISRIRRGSVPDDGDELPDARAYWSCPIPRRRCQLPRLASASGWPTPCSTARRWSGLSFSRSLSV